jgi:hypothetical protein
MIGIDSVYGSKGNIPEQFLRGAGVPDSSITLIKSLPVGLAAFDAIRTWECFDADTGKDSAREIREYLIPDFSNWTDHNSYLTAFDRLLHDLRADAPSAASAAE